MVGFEGLICEESSSCLDGGEEEEMEIGGVLLSSDGTVNCDDDDDDDEHIQVLLTTERSAVGTSGDRVDVSICFGDWLKRSRSDAVRWILKTRERFGFNCRTAYLAVNYLDRFFVKRTLQTRQIWAFQLLSVACLSLAAKMEECRVPALSDFQLDEWRFDNNSIKRMELLVLTTLEWQMRSVTPFPYLSYLASTSKLRREGFIPIDFLFTAAQVILAAIETMNSVDYLPSVMATAVFLIASETGITPNSLEFKVATISLCGSLNTEDVISCYHKIRESQKEKPEMDILPNPEHVPSSTNLSIQSHAEDTDNDSAAAVSSCTSSNKRRRLALKAYSRHSLICKENTSE